MSEGLTSRVACNRPGEGYELELEKAAFLLPAACLCFPGIRWLSSSNRSAWSYEAKPRAVGPGRGGLRAERVLVVRWPGLAIRFAAKPAVRPEAGHRRPHGERAD